MKIDGKRADGAVLVLLDGGLACIVRGSVASPAVDEGDARKLGPWGDADSSLPARRAMTAHLERTRTVPLHALRQTMTLATPAPAAPVADAATLKAASEEHQTAATNEDIDIEKMQEDADEMAADALEQSEAAETAEEHRAASEALDAAAAAQEAVEKLRQPATPAPGTPEFDAYIEAEVARRVAEAGMGGDPAAGVVVPIEAASDPLDTPRDPLMLEDDALAVEKDPITGKPMKKKKGVMVVPPEAAEEAASPIEVPIKVKLDE